MSLSETQHDHPQGHHLHPAPADVPPPSPQRLRRVGSIVAIVAVAVAIAGIAIRWIHERDVRQWATARATPVVSVITPVQGVSGQQTTLPGNIQAWYEAPLYARVSGYLKKWYEDYGAHVKKGQLLAEIDAPEVDA
jgi:multidrug efflux pump subunit AcrA (membrane-fusion protein)